MALGPAPPHVLAMVLAGGEGKRLMPLTALRAKPAVPFGAQYRLIDFALSNLVNGGIRQIVVLTQYKSHSLDVHVSRSWRMSPLLGSYVTSVPAQMRAGPHWFQGSADAIYQNLNLIDDERPDYVFVFGADHIYRLDPRQMLAHHIESGAGVTVAGIRVPRSECDQFGVIIPDGHRISRFVEKPAVSETTGLPDSPDEVLASMGNYVFTCDELIDLVHEDSTDESSKHDVGGDLIPAMVAKGRASVYDFTTNEIPGQDSSVHYWRDVGTLDSYYDAHMDLVSEWPDFDLYNREWPILTLGSGLPPAKLVPDQAGTRSEVTRSILGSGVIVSGATVASSVLFDAVRVGSGAEVDGSVLLDGARVERGAVVRNAILDKHVVVETGASVGIDPEADQARFTVSAGGVVVVAKNTRVEPTPARRNRPRPTTS